MKRRTSPVLLLFLGASLAFSQQGRGTINGTVVDPSGAAVPAAAVIVRNVATNIAAATSTNEAGHYIVPAVAVGDYSIAVEKPGFKKVVRTGIRVEVDQRTAVVIRLEIGDASATINVVAETPLVETGSATVGKVVENRRINDLPLNGRNVFALVMLAPGARSPAGPTTSGFGDRGLLLSSVSVNGGPSASNALVLDGGNNNSAYMDDVNVNPSVEAMEEFRVQSGVIPAEAGFTLGGVINMVTKSGTNQFHGTLYEFMRNNVLDARNAFAAEVAPFRYNQFGGSIGGPVQIPPIYNGKDRSFFFFNYEGWRLRKYASNILTVATAAERKGDFSALADANGKAVPIYDPATTRVNPNGSGYIRDAFAGNVIPNSRLDPVSVNMLQFFPLPNRAPSNQYTQSNNWIGMVDTTRRMNQTTSKFDHRFSDSNNFTLRHSYYYHFDDNGILSPYPDPNTRLRLDNYTNHNAVLIDTHTFSPRILNELRVGVARQFFPFLPYCYGKEWPQKLGLPSSVPGYTLPQVYTGMSANFWPFTLGRRGVMTWQMFDMGTFILGNHTLKVGADVRLYRMNNAQPSNPSGSFNFGLTNNPQIASGTGSTFAGFMLGAVTSATVPRWNGVSQIGHSTSFFVQDDWRITRSLTLNLGLRYDYQANPVERYDRLANFNPFAVIPTNGLLGRMDYAGVDYGRSHLQPMKLNFSPRLGFAYNLFGRGTTVIRGGYGMVYENFFPMLGQGSGQGFSSYTTTYSSAITAYPVFQFKDGFPYPFIEPLGRQLGPAGFLGQSVSYYQGKEGIPYSQQWSLSLQQQFPGGWLIEAAYSGNKGTHLAAGSYNYNSLDPQYYSLGLALSNAVPNPYAGMVTGSLGAATITRKQSLLPYPYYNAINTASLLGSSIYHALLFSAERRLVRGMSLLLSYTNGKIISDSVASQMGWVSGMEGSSLTGYQDGRYNRRAERSVDPTDISQRLVVSGVVDLPFGKGRRWSPSNRTLRHVASGWQVDVIATVQAGNPIYVRGASNYVADRPNSTGASAYLSERTQYRWFDTTQFVNPPNFTYGNVGRTLPDVRNPGTVNFDLSAIKATHITEQVRVEFRAEAFNVLNHMNLGNVTATFSPGSNGLNASATFGTITKARDPRMLQFGIKLAF